MISQSAHLRGGSTVRILFAWCLAVGLCCTASRARGQAVDLAPIEPSPSIAARIHWIQFNMVSGRVMASSSHVVPMMTVPVTTARTNRREQLSIEINNPLSRMQYALVAPNEQFQLSLTNGNQLSIRRTHSSGKYVLDYQQRADQPVVLTLEQNGVKQSWRAGGFWQLWIANPDVVRRHLVPLLELLHPSWQLASTGTEIEDALVQSAHQAQQPDRQRWSRLVDDLASPKFARRETAQRELYRAGQVVVPFLQSLDRGRLDAEQAYRVRALVEALSVDYEDKVERIVTWLAADEHVWLSLMERGESAKRRIAAERLAATLAAPIEFDPAAAAEVRQVQIERLRARLLPPPAAQKAPSRGATAQTPQAEAGARP